MTEFRGQKFGRVLSVDEDGFAIIKIKIYLTWQPQFMVSVLSPELELHLLITTLGEIVIFYDINNFLEV